MRLKSNHKITLAETLDNDGHWYFIECLKHRCHAHRKYFPSSSTILRAYPQSSHLTRWVAETGWNESQQIKRDAGKRGTAVHKAIEFLLTGAELLREGYSLEEWWKISTFIDWYHTKEPKVLASELPVVSIKYGYAGTIDRVYRIEDKLVIVDDKTSGSIYKHFALQTGSYANAFVESTNAPVDATAILQLGAKNKNGWRFVESPEWRADFRVFLGVKSTWEYEVGYGKPDFKVPVLSLPKTLKL